MSSEEVLSLEQKAFIKGYQKFDIRGDGDLEVHFKRLSTQRQFRIPLWQIEPKSQRHKSLNSGALAGLLIFGILTLITLWGIVACLRSATDKDVATVLVIPLLFFGIFAWISFWRLKTQSVNAIIFYTRNGGQIHVWFERPDAARFNGFCETLVKRSEEAWNNRPLDPAVQSIAGEIVALKKLHDQGILTDSEFEHAKAKLIDQTAERRIGFAQ